MATTGFYPLRPDQKEIFIGPDRIRFVVDSVAEEERLMKSHAKLMKAAAPVEGPSPESKKRK
jgi:hypothetical protein